MSKILTLGTLGKDPAAVLVDTSGRAISAPVIKDVPVGEENSQEKRFTGSFTNDKGLRQYLDSIGHKAINLEALIDSKCKKCYGRGYIGYKLPVDKDERKDLDAKDRRHIFCSCLIKAFQKAVQQANEEKRALVQVGW